MNQLLHWLDMGGYAFYVWPAYSVVFTVLLGNALTVKWHKKQVQQKLAQWFDVRPTSRGLSAGSSALVKTMDPADEPREVAPE